MDKAEERARELVPMFAKIRYDVDHDNVLLSWQEAIATALRRERAEALEEAVNAASTTKRSAPHRDAGPGEGRKVAICQAYMDGCDAAATAIRALAHKESEHA